MERVVRIVEMKDRLRSVLKALRFICLIILVIEVSIVLKNSGTESNLQDCFLSIQNFVTVRQNRTENDFELKTYASSFTSPYLIELIQNSQRDCLCCP